MRRRKPDSRTAKPDRSRLERRRLIVGALCFVWFVFIAARLYYLQVIQYTGFYGSRASASSSARLRWRRSAEPSTTGR